MASCDGGGLPIEGEGVEEEAVPDGIKEERERGRDGRMPRGAESGARREEVAGVEEGMVVDRG